MTDGLSGSDSGSTTLTTQLSANWDASTDAQSGISKYWYAIGTTVGGTNVTGWANNGTARSVTRTGLTLTTGTTYYFSVKAENGVGLEGGARNSNGQYIFQVIIDNKVGIYPNPCRISDTGKISILISEPSTGGNVKIFTLSGKLIRELTIENGADRTDWDCRNADDEKISRGIYVLKITNNGVSDTKTIAIK